MLSLTTKEKFILLHYPVMVIIQIKIKHNEKLLNKAVRFFGLPCFDFSYRHFRLHLLSAGNSLKAEGRADKIPCQVRDNKPDSH